MGAELHWEAAESRVGVKRSVAQVGPEANAEDEAPGPRAPEGPPGAGGRVCALQCRVRNPERKRCLGSEEPQTQKYRFDQLSNLMCFTCI